MKRSSKIYLSLFGIIAVIVLLWLAPWQKDGSTIDADPKSIDIEDQFGLLDDFAVRLVASEPDIINPITMAVDDYGSIYVSESSTYRYGIEGAPSTDVLNPIKRIEVDSSGKAIRTTLVMEGFENPVMGIDVYGDKLYATCLNELFVMDIGQNGELTNRQLLVKDSAEPWNPFGMYRVVMGPDAKLWLAIADHPDSEPVTLTGSDGRKVRLRGQSGGLVRCNPDGSELEVMVQGFRAPFAFDIDPWGHLWTVSNGEGSPNIYADVIPGMDYGYHSRDVSYAWLAGKTRLAPPVYQMGPGANTIGLHYYGSMFPKEFWGSIFLGNWGSHGAYPTNRSIGVILQKEENSKATGAFNYELPKSSELFLTSGDSLFRPVSMVPAPDGGLYLADWHGRDDDSNMTGRIFKISYTGKKNQKSEDLVQSDKIRQMNYAELCDLLGNHNRSIREQAKRMLLDSGNSALKSLGKVVKNKNAFAAANAIWTLTSMKSEDAAQTLALAVNNPDARVRALGLRQLRQATGQKWGSLSYPDSDGVKYTSSKLISEERLATLATPLIQDSNAEVRIEAALSLISPEQIRRGLLCALDIVEDRRLRYQIGFELGRYGDKATLTRLRNDPDANKRRVALIAAQTAINENTAVAVDIRDWDLNQDQQNEAENLVAEIQDGKSDLKTEDSLIVLKWLEENPPETVNKPLLEFLSLCLGDDDELVQEAALRNVSLVGFHDPMIKAGLTKILNNKESTFSDIQLQALYYLGLFVDISSPQEWIPWLQHNSEDVVITTLRSLRHHHPNSNFIEALWPSALSAAQRDPFLCEEVLYTFQQDIQEEKIEKLPVVDPARPAAKDELAKEILSELKGASHLRGRWSFNNLCARCHAVQSGLGENLLGPNLASIGVASQPQYLIESILEPSKVLKTGYQVETLETTDGQSFTGQTEIENDQIIVKRFGAKPLGVPMDNVKRRTTSHMSLMPAGLDNAMTTGELADLTRYLTTLREE